MLNEYIDTLQKQKLFIELTSSLLANLKFDEKSIENAFEFLDQAVNDAFQLNTQLHAISSVVSDQSLVDDVVTYNDAFHDIYHELENADDMQDEDTQLNLTQLVKTAVSRKSDALVAVNNLLAQAKSE